MVNENPPKVCLEGAAFVFGIANLPSISDGSAPVTSRLQLWPF